MTVRIEIDRPALETNQAMLRFFQEFGRECLKEAQRLSAQRISGGSGVYERSFDMELIGGSPPKLLFGNKAPHAIYVEEDTRPHTIEPTPKGRRSFTNPDHSGALRFWDPPGGGAGAAVFAQKVNHPGTKGQHIIRDAVSAAGDRLQGNQGRLI